MKIWTRTAGLWGIALVLSACGGGGGGSASPSDVLSGQFLDSAVQGLGYQTVSQSGYTDGAGTFTYKEGEVIEFKIGEMTLGYAQAKPIITPLDMVGALSSDDPNAVNIAQLLQTLDIDGDPSNGIALPPSSNLAAGTDITDEASITTSLTAFDSSITTLVPDADAQTHLEGTLATLPPPPAFTSDYTYLLGTTNPDSAIACSSASVSNMTVTRNSDGSYDVSALITVGGNLETINLTQVTLGYWMTHYTDAGTPFQLSLDQKRAVLSWGYVRDAGVPVDTTACWGAALLSAADGVNDAPFAVAKEEIIPAQCIIDYNDGSQTDGVTLMFAAKDGDGYINGPGVLKVSGDVATTTVLTHTSDPSVSYPASQTGSSEFTADGAFDYAVSDPFGKLMLSATPTYGGVVTGDTFTISKDCSKAVSWEYTVTDNEGASHTIRGSVPARDVAPVLNTNSAYINGTAAQVYEAVTLGDVNDLNVSMYYGNYDLGLSVYPLPTSGTVDFPVSSRNGWGSVTAWINDLSDPNNFYAYLVGGTVTVNDVDGNRVISIAAVLDVEFLDGVYYDEGALSYSFSATITNPQPAQMLP